MSKNEENLYNLNKIKLRQIKTYDGSFLMSPKNDFVFKKIFADENNKDILKSFLSAVMKIRPDRFDDLEIRNTEMAGELAEDKTGILDVRVQLKDGMQINIEIQLGYTKYMPERTLFYWSKMYMRNIKSGDSYAKIKKCVTINILDFVAVSLDQIYSKFYIREENTGYRLTDVLEIYYLELPKLKDEKLKAQVNLDDPIVQWMLFLEANTKEVLDMLATRSPEIKKATDILEIMSRSEKDRELYEAREIQLRDIITGLEEAKEEGIIQGMEKGAYIKARETAIELLNDGMEIALVAKYTKLTKDEVKRIKEEL